MTFIVHGATGAQGSPVLSALAASGHSVTAAVRDPSSLDNVPAVAVDFASVDSLVTAYEGAEGVFVHLPIGAPDDQLAWAGKIGEAVKRARPARVVFSTSGYTVGTAAEPVGAADALIAELERGGVSFAVVEPRLYLENLLMPMVFEPAREQGILRYPLRDDYATSWSSHLDVADVVVRLLVDHSVSGTVSVGALPGLVGDDLAQGFARHLGRDVRFESLDPEEFGRLLAPMIGERGARPVVDSYKWRQGQPDEVIPENQSAQGRLGLTPRTIEQWLDNLGL